MTEWDFYDNDGFHRKRIENENGICLLGMSFGVMVSRVADHLTG